MAKLEFLSYDWAPDASACRANNCANVNQLLKSCFEYRTAHVALAGKAVSLLRQRLTALKHEQGELQMQVIFPGIQAVNYSAPLSYEAPKIWQLGRHGFGLSLLLAVRLAPHLRVVGAFVAETKKPGDWPGSMSISRVRISRLRDRKQAPARE
ncbi:hypothetical protein [Mesorhizobium sp.]|uniref:hypothetical protein n=1 Tax=Mesorhizobium sp. TaxID=1871066 RepID=UPI0025BBE050|nr:hypothetical protein [Mesorhizobium sp.]